MTTSLRATPRAERTRAAILAAAEDLFATRGFDATRLEDVAERVGIRRASIVYYFRDKRKLYEAVLDDVFGELFEHTASALLAGGPLAARIEAAVGAWVDCAVLRPALPRLLLREVADAARGETPLRRHTAPFFELITRLLDDTKGDPLRRRGFDPAHVASAIAGTSIFYLAAMPSLAPQPARSPDAERETHRRELLRVVRRVLAIPEPEEA